MNHIEIKYSYFSQKAEFLMNREKVSPYSELASIGNSPFLEAVASIIHCLDNEVFDDYEIDLYATDFQYELLSAIARKSEYCKISGYFQWNLCFRKKNCLNEFLI